MPPELAEVWRWIDKAEQDRSAARRLFTPGCLERAVIGFLCQQAVEKLLKSFLISRGVEPERTHDLRRLAEQCAETDTGFAAMIESVDRITVFAVAHRYPGPAEPTPDQLWDALGAVEGVREEVLRRIPARPGGA